MKHEEKVADRKMICYSYNVWDVFEPKLSVSECKIKYTPPAAVTDVTKTNCFYENL